MLHSGRVYLNGFNSLGIGTTSVCGFNPRYSSSISNAVCFKSKIVSFPVGYYNAAFKWPISVGGIGSKIKGNGSLTLDLNAVGNIDSTLSGTGDITSTNLAGGYNMASTLEGSGTLTASPKAIANLNALIKIGASPSSDDIVYALLDTPTGNIDNLSLRQALQVMVSIMAGKTTIDNSTVKFRDMEDTKDRVTVDMTGSERTTITIGSD